MKYISASEAAAKWGLSSRRVGILCNEDRINIEVKAAQGVYSRKCLGTMFMSYRRNHEGDYHCTKWIQAASDYGND